MTQVPTTDQIRTAIDSGATGEKVGYPDTAAAPLGTDAEAGGRPPTRTEHAIEANAQVEHRDPVTWNGPLVYFGLIALVCGKSWWVCWRSNPEVPLLRTAEAA